MITLNFATAGNIVFAFIMVYAVIYFAYLHGRSILGDWVGTILVLNLGPGLVRLVYYFGTIFLGWTRSSHGNMVAYANWFALLGAALLLFSWAQSIKENKELKSENQQLKEQERHDNLTII